MRFEAEPHVLIRPYVHSYWGFVRDLSPMRQFSVTPDCFVEVMFFVDPPAVEDAVGHVRRLPACVLIPLLREPLRLVTDGVVRCASVRVHAWAAGIIFPQANVSNGAWFDASADFADMIPAVTEALRRTAWSEISAMFDTTLRRELANARPAASAVSAVRGLSTPVDGISTRVTGTVAAAQGVSRRQIERYARSLTNRSPKELISLTRFQFVRDTLWANPDTALDRLAIEAGYADQAHLSRHFRRYCAQSPSQFKRDCVRLKAWLESEDVAFVQDAASQAE